MELYLVIGTNVNGEIVTGNPLVYKTYKEAYEKLIEYAKECRVNNLETDWNEDMLTMLVTDENDILLETHRIYKRIIDF